MSEGKIKIIVIDDHPVMREGLSILINQQKDMEVCGEAGGLAEASNSPALIRADAAVVDISLKDGSGIDLIRQIKEKRPVIKVLVYSMHEEAHFASRALQAGAGGYVVKSEPPRRVIEALRQVMAGELAVSDDVQKILLQMVFAEKQTGESSPAAKLTDRELEVFRLIGEAYTTRQIAEKLNISVKTAQTYRERIKEKLGISTSQALIQQAARWVTRIDRK
jgi:DNA-binding NarL/FixJ family response regulator